MHALRTFLRQEASGGIVLLAAAIVAVVWANTGPGSYAAFVHAPVPLAGGTLEWAINDGLMVLFFLSVGLEIKRELVTGELSDLRSAALPALAAVAGMVVPALIYLAAGGARSATVQGWAIPCATDIAFAVGVLALAGPRVPQSLKVFLLALAIIDDLGAILIIALFYTGGLAAWSLLAAAICTGILVFFNAQGVRSVWPYLVAGVALWLAVLTSGIHATVAGVILAMTISVRLPPLVQGRAGEGLPPATRLSHALHPWVAFAIVPLFALANAGVSLDGLTLGALLAPLPFAIAAGLFLGKQLGVFGAVFLAVRSGLVPPLRDATWMQVWGVALLCGIGFTMSLFLGTLAFGGSARFMNDVRLGVLTGSILSAAAGLVVLRFAPSRTSAS